MGTKFEKAIQDLKEQFDLIQKRHQQNLTNPLISWWDLDEETVIRKDSHNINYLI